MQTITKLIVPIVVYWLIVAFLNYLLQCYKIVIYTIAFQNVEIY